MKGVEGCGNGAWELVMSMRGNSNKVLNFRTPLTNTNRRLYNIQLVANPVFINRESDAIMGNSAFYIKE